MSNEIPRRARLDQMHPAELAIREATVAIETMGCDTRLSTAQVWLGRARDLVADFIDSSVQTPTAETGEAIIDRWRDGDGMRVHCTHCEICGCLFPSARLDMHVKQAHLGSRKAYVEHQEFGKRLLLSILSPNDKPDETKLQAWAKVERNLQTVKEWIDRP